MVVDQNVADITALISTYTTVIVPAVLALLFSIINFINHNTHSATIKKLDDKFESNLSKIQEVDGKVAANTDKIQTGLSLAESLSPEVKNAIVASHPDVIKLKAQSEVLQGKIDNLTSMVQLVGINNPATTTTNTAAHQGNKTTSA